jgi:hypothetical protein
LRCSYWIPVECRDVENVVYTSASRRKDSGFPYDQDSGFPYGCADAAAADGRRGSNVYEVNLWLLLHQLINHYYIEYLLIQILAIIDY